MTKPASATRLLTAEEVEEIYNFKASYMKEQARQGRIACVKFDKWVRFDPADVEAWIDARRRAAH